MYLYLSFQNIGLLTLGQCSKRMGGMGGGWVVRLGGRSVGVGKNPARVAKRYLYCVYMYKFSRSQIQFFYVFHCFIFTNA